MSAGPGLSFQNVDAAKLKQFKATFGKRAKLAGKIVKKLAKTAEDLRNIDGMDSDQALFVAADLLGLDIGHRHGH